MIQKSKDILLFLVKLSLKTIVIGLMFISMICWSVFIYVYLSLYINSFVILMLVIWLFGYETISSMRNNLLLVFMFPSVIGIILLDFIDEY